MRPMMILLSVLLVSMSALSVQAGQLLCGKHADVVASLEKAHAEKQVAIGLAGNGSVIEVFSSPDGGFTITMTQPEGLSCLVAAGEGWQNIVQKVATKGEGI